MLVYPRCCSVHKLKLLLVQCSVYQRPSLPRDFMHTDFKPDRRNMQIRAEEEYFCDIVKLYCVRYIL